MSVGRAVLIGRIVVNGPVFLFLMGAFAVPIVLIPRLGAWVAVIFVLFFSLAWLWWSLSIPRWRLWAFERVTSIIELKHAAVLAGLTWPDGHFFERTEIKSAAIREKEKYLASKVG